MRSGLALIVLWIVPAAAFQSPVPRNEGVPSFQDYSVPPSQIFKGTPASPQFKTAGQRLFRTRIRQGAAEGANFAGHYAIAQWGCGSNCVGLAVIDVQSGEVFDSPFGAPDTAYIGFVPPFEERGLFFHVDSRLFIANGCPNDKSCGVYFYEWTGTGFRRLR